VSVYKVTGRADFDGYPPGSTFEAVLDENKAHRAIRRGSIQLVEESKPTLVPGSYRLPRG
jgi:hypothetical protein